MILFDGAAGLIVFGLWIFCLIDVITTPEGDCRNLPKMVWLLIVLFLFDVGAIVWLVAGRNWNRQPANLPYKGNRGYAPPAPSARYPASNPDDDEQFLAQLRARTEEQRRRARETQQRDDQPPPA